MEIFCSAVQCRLGTTLIISTLASFVDTVPDTVPAPSPYSGLCPLELGATPRDTFESENAGLQGPLANVDLSYAYDHVNNPHAVRPVLWVKRAPITGN